MPLRKILFLGDGDGRFAARLLRRAPSADAMALDSSAAMLDLLRTRCNFASSRLTTLHCAVAQLPEAGDLQSVDLVVTHFFLDCLSQAQVDALAGQLAGAVAPGCLWLISDFGIPARQPWRALARVYVGLLYLAFRLLTRLPVGTLPAIGPSLAAAGFERIQHREFMKGLLYTQIWRLTR